MILEINKTNSINLFLLHKVTNYSHRYKVNLYFLVISNTHCKIIQTIITMFLRYVSRLFRMRTFIDSTHMKLFEVISADGNALVVPFQQLLEGSVEVFLC